MAVPARWLIDFDGCVVTTMLNVVDRINDKFETTFCEADMVDLPDFWKDVVPEDMVKWAWGPECFDNEDFLNHVTPNEGAQTAIQLLLKANCPVIINCDRPIHQVPWVTRWLAQHDMVVPVISSQSFEGNKEKIIEEYSITCTVDDSSASSQKYADKRSTSLVFLYDAPWNKTMYLPLETKVKRLYGWGDLIDRILEEQPDHDIPSTN